MRRLLAEFLCLVCLASGWTSVFANEADTRAEAAVSAILFDNDADTLASFKVTRGGHVDITFSGNMPEDRYNHIMKQLRESADISGVLGSRGQALRCGVNQF
ncbi:MAG: hypothetical protein KDG50_15520 [Chromatiales bacterium]|nr:hypothetical protein [Chromatiales bacterium]